MKKNLFLLFMMSTITQFITKTNITDGMCMYNKPNNINDQVSICQQKIKLIKEYTANKNDEINNIDDLLNLIVYIRNYICINILEHQLNDSIKMYGCDLSVNLTYIQTLESMIYELKNTLRPKPPVKSSTQNKSIQETQQKQIPQQLRLQSVIRPKQNKPIQQDMPYDEYTEESVWGQQQYANLNSDAVTLIYEDCINLFDTYRCITNQLLRLQNLLPSSQKEDDTYIMYSEENKAIQQINSLNALNDKNEHYNKTLENEQNRLEKKYTQLMQKFKLKFEQDKNRLSKQGDETIESPQTTETKSLNAQKKINDIIQCTHEINLYIAKKEFEIDKYRIIADIIFTKMENILILACPLDNEYVVFDDEKQKFTLFNDLGHLRNDITDIKNNIFKMFKVQNTEVEINNSPTIQDLQNEINDAHELISIITDGKITIDKKEVGIPSVMDDEQYLQQCIKELRHKVFEKQSALASLEKKNELLRQDISKLELFMLDKLELKDIQAIEQIMQENKTMFSDEKILFRCYDIYKGL